MSLLNSARNAVRRSHIRRNQIRTNNMGQTDMFTFVALFFGIFLIIMLSQFMDNSNKEKNSETETTETETTQRENFDDNQNTKGQTNFKGFMSILIFIMFFFMIAMFSNMRSNTSYMPQRIYTTRRPRLFNNIMSSIFS